MLEFVSFPYFSIKPTGIMLTIFHAVQLCYMNDNGWCKLLTDHKTPILSSSKLTRLPLSRQITIKYKPARTKTTLQGCTTNQSPYKLAHDHPAGFVVTTQDWMITLKISDHLAGLHVITLQDCIVILQGAVDHPAGLDGHLVRFSFITSIWSPCRYHSARSLEFRSPRSISQCRKSQDPKFSLLLEFLISI